MRKRGEMQIQDGSANFKVRSLVKTVNGKHADSNGNVEVYDGLKTLTDFLNVIYPVGSIKISVTNQAPFASIGFGTWQEVGKGRVLWGGDNGGSTIEAGLPNIWGNFPAVGFASSSAKWEGAFYQNGQSTGVDVDNGGNPDLQCFMDASRCSGIYGRSGTVQPPAYVVHFWQRTK